jgi:hypothetical protein
MRFGGGWNWLRIVSNGGDFILLELELHILQSQLEYQAGFLLFHHATLTEHNLSCLAVHNISLYFTHCRRKITTVDLCSLLSSPASLHLARSRQQKWRLVTTTTRR